MADDAKPVDLPPAKKSKMPLIIGLVLALVLGGGGYFATSSGLILGGDKHAAPTEVVPELPAIAFVPLDTLVINLGTGRDNRHLRFGAQLEVEAAYADEVTMMKPRLADVLNGYLRAIDIATFDDPSALVRLRAQLLRRMQVVTGDGRVRDFLVTEFLVN